MRLLSLLLLASTGCVVSETDSSLFVENRSDFEIYEMYVTEIDNPSWGPNLIDDVMFPGDTMIIGLECGTYDALLVDETDATCEVEAIDLCFEDADWIIRNSSCLVFE
jgi:hypothetical protein